MTGCYQEFIQQAKPKGLFCDMLLLAFLPTSNNNTKGASYDRKLPGYSNLTCRGPYDRKAQATCSALLPSTHSSRHPYQPLPPYHPRAACLRPQKWAAQALAEGCILLQVLPWPPLKLPWPPLELPWPPLELP